MVRSREVLSEELAGCRCLPYFDGTKVQQYINYKHCYWGLTWEEAITYVNIGLDQEYYTCVTPVKSPQKLTVLVNKYRQLPEDYIPNDLEVIAPECNSSSLMLRYPAKVAFEGMCSAAGREGLELKAISTFRSFLYQNQVYYKNWTGEVSLEQYQKERDRVSARAGYSEHQTGLAVDINDLEQTFEETPEGRWLAQNSWKYGFILRYPKGKEHITGYDYEPWHFRYIGPVLACVVYKSGLTYDEYYVRYLAPAQCRN